MSATQQMIVAVLTSSGFTALVLKIIDIISERMKEARDKKNNVETVEAKLDKVNGKLDMVIGKLDKTDAVTMADARDKIYHLCKTAIEKHDTDADTMRDIQALMGPYKANGGDGLADDIYEAYKRMYEEYVSK